jgi:hypothetical protein
LPISRQPLEIAGNSGIMPDNGLAVCGENRREVARPQNNFEDTNVRSRARNGKHLLAASISLFDP